jgi:hypothetical protein
MRFSHLDGIADCLQQHRFAQHASRQTAARESLQGRRSLQRCGGGCALLTELPRLEQHLLARLSGLFAPAEGDALPLAK